jgi:5-methylcytosine-specific restriction endonuclease McrA
MPQTKEYFQQYYQEHKDDYAERDKRWLQANREGRKVIRRRTYLKHRTKNLEDLKVWKQNNPEKLKAQYKRKDVKRRSRKRNMQHHTFQEWANMLVFFNNRCATCGIGEDITRDHITPLVSGGDDSITNLQPLCRRCNSMKGIQDNDYHPFNPYTPFE